MNRFQSEGEGTALHIPTLRIDEAVQRSKIDGLRRLKAERSASAVESALSEVRRAAEGTENVVPSIVAAAKTFATEQEVCDVLRDVLGTYTDPAEF